MTDTRLSDSDIARGLSGSRFARKGDAIIAESEFTDFAAAVAAVNAIAAVAEERNHHPDLLVYGWNHLRVTLSTHSAGGITALDLELAARIDELI